MKVRRPRRHETRDVFGRADVALVTAEEAVAIDAAARAESGVPEPVLMENAGRAAALILHKLFPRGRVLVLAGSGNNGGDALVIARTLHTWGRDVSIYAAGSRAPDASLLHGFDLDFETPAILDAALCRAEVIVDGLLGTGVTGAPRHALAEVINLANGSGRPVFALDLPSGVDGTTGAVPGAAVDAAVTVTFGWPKLGCLLHPGRRHCGRLVAVEIGFPPLPGAAVRAQLLTGAWAAARVPIRSADAHKSTAGRLGILAGQEGMAGAAALAAEAARSAGAGLIRLASAAGNRAILQTLVPEATFVDRARLDRSDFSSVHALVAGPGIGSEDDVLPVLEQALELTGTTPVLLDADALNLYAKNAERLARLAATRAAVITPHPKELERLTGIAAGQIQADRVRAVREASSRFGCVVLLKGQPSLIAAPDGRLLVNAAGSSDLAGAGMGDQLAGVIGAFLAAGAEPLDAAGAGLYLSARAADLAGYGRSLGPRDISAHFRLALERPGARRSSLDLPFVTFDQPARW